MPAITFQDEEQKRRFRQMWLNQISQPEPPKKQGFIKRNLPTIGAVGAGVLAAPLTGGMSLLPSIALLGAAGAAGSGVGEKIRQKFSGENDPEKMFREMAYGGAGGAAGPIIGKGFQALKAARVAKAGTDIATRESGSVVKKIGTSMRKSVINPDVVDSPTSIFKEDDLVKFAANEGLKGSGAAQRVQVAKNFSLLNDQIDEALGQSKRAFSGKTVIKQLKLGSDKSINFVPGDVAFERARERALTKLATLSETNKLTAKELFRFKNDLGGRLGNAFKKVRGELQTPLTVNEGAEMALWESVDDIITRIEPGVKELTKRQSMYHQLAPGIIKKAESIFKVPMLGVEVPGVSNVSQATTDLVGRGMQGASGIGGQFPKLPLGKVTGQTALQASVRRFGQEPQTDMSVGLEFPSEMGMAEAEQPASESASGFTAEGIQKAMMDDLMTTGGKNIAFLKQIAEISGVNKKSQELTADQQKRLTNIGNVEGSINELEDTLSGLNPSTSQLGATIRGAYAGKVGRLVDPKIRAYYDTVRADAISAIRAAGEVGNLSATEQEAAIKLIPTLSDSVEAARLKFKKLRTKLVTNARASALSFGGYQQSPQEDY